MTFTKMNKADLESPCRELSNGGLGIVAVLLVRWKIDFSCASRSSAIQLNDVFGEEVIYDGIV